MTNRNGQSRPLANGGVLPTAKKIKEYLDRYVYGQEQAKRDLAMAVVRHFVGRATQRDLGRMLVCLIGPSASGKTELVKRLIEFLHLAGFDVPAIVVDACGMAGTGYVGMQTENVLRDLYIRADADRERAEMGIVFIDEIDKKAVQPTGGQRDVSGADVQAGLLKIFEGTTLSFKLNGDERGEIDTGKILFIVGGAFVGLTGIVRRRIEGGAGRVGFHAHSPAEDVDEAGLLARVSAEDLIEFGMIPELVGRLTRLTHTRPLGRDELAEILRSTEESSLRKLQAYFAAHGVELVLTDNALVEIAEQAVRLGTGARGLDRYLAAAVADLEFELPELAERGARRITIDSAALRGESRPRIEFGDERAVASLQRKPFRLRAPESGAVTGTDPERDRIEYLKLKSLEWDSANPAAKQWFRRWEAHTQPGFMIRFVQALASRKPPITINEIYGAWLASSQNTDAWSLLQYIDQRRAHLANEHRRREGLDADLDVDLDSDGLDEPEAPAA